MKKIKLTIKKLIGYRKLKNLSELCLDLHYQGFSNINGSIRLNSTINNQTWLLFNNEDVALIEDNGYDINILNITTKDRFDYSISNNPYRLTIKNHNKLVDLDKRCCYGPTSLALNINRFINK